MKIYLNLEAPYEWVRVSGQKVEAFGEVPGLSDYPINEDDEVIGVVSGEWATTHTVTLPAKSRKQFSAALPYSLEESISEEVENMHFVFPVWKAGEPCNVSVVAKDKMLAWQQLANEHQLPVQRLIPDYQLVPFHEAADCSIALTGDQLLAHHRDGYGVSIDRDFLEVWLMDVPMNATIAVNDEQLTEELIDRYPDRDFRHWPFGNKMAHWLEYQTDSSLDLWADKYTPKVRRFGRQSLIMPVAVLLGAFFVKVAFDGYRYFALHSEIEAIHAESQQILAEAFPLFDNVQPGTERTLMEQAIARMGGPEHRDSLHSALAEVAAVLSRQRISLTNIVYRNNELVITCLLNDFSQVDALAKQFNDRRTLSASLQSSSSEDGKVIASYSINSK